MLSSNYGVFLGFLFYLFIQSFFEGSFYKLEKLVFEANLTYTPSTMEYLQ